MKQLGRHWSVGCWITALGGLLAVIAPVQAHANSRPPIIADSTAGVALFSVTVVGDWAYCAIGIGLQVMDVSNPGAPQFVSRLALGAPRQALPIGHFRIQVVGSYAYVPDWDDGIYVVDISNPAQPQVAGQFDSVGNVKAVVVHGAYAYTAAALGPLYTLQLTGPTQATVVDSVLDFLVVADLCLVDSTLYAAADFLYTFNVSDPSHPVFMHSHNGPSRTFSVASQGHYLYVADWWSWASGGIEGLGIFDITDPNLPVLVGTNPHHVDDLDATPLGSFCYMTNGQGGLHAVDIADPANPFYVECYDVGALPGCSESFTGPYSTRSVTTVDSFVYVSSDQGLLIYALQSRGDINASGEKNAADIILLVNYVFKSGPPPTPVEQGDTECRGGITSADIIYLVNYVFKGSYAPLCP